MAKINSAVVIAKLIGAEGFSDHVANQVEKYWRSRSGLTERQRKSISRLEKEITRMCETMSEGDKLIFGKFIGLHKKMSFDTGLKIGLAAFAQKCDKPVEKEDMDSSK